MASRDRSNTLGTSLPPNLGLTGLASLGTTSSKPNAGLASLKPNSIGGVSSGLAGLASLKPNSMGGVSSGLAGLASLGTTSAKPNAGLASLRPIGGPSSGLASLGVTSAKPNFGSSGSSLTLGLNASVPNKSSGLNTSTTTGLNNPFQPISGLPDSNNNFLNASSTTIPTNRDQQIASQQQPTSQSPWGPTSSDVMLASKRRRSAAALIHSNASQTKDLDGSQSALELKRYKSLVSSASLPEKQPLYVEPALVTKFEGKENIFFSSNKIIPPMIMNSTDTSSKNKDKNNNNSIMTLSGIISNRKDKSYVAKTDASSAEGDEDKANKKWIMTDARSRKPQVTVLGKGRRFNPFKLSYDNNNIDDYEKMNGAARISNDNSVDDGQSESSSSALIPAPLATTIPVIEDSQMVVVAKDIPQLLKHQKYAVSQSYVVSPSAEELEYFQQRGEEVTNLTVSNPGAGSITWNYKLSLNTLNVYRLGDGESYIKITKNGVKVDIWVNPKLSVLYTGPVTMSLRVGELASSEKFRKVATRNFKKKYNDCTINVTEGEEPETISFRMNHLHEVE